MNINETLIFETLDSILDVKRNKELEKQFNSVLGNKVFPGHTNVYHTDHMINNNLSVLRVMTNSKTPKIEYHLISSKHSPEEKSEIKDNKSVLHAMNIISNDAKFHLDQGRSIAIHSPTEGLHNVYQKFAKHLLKKDKFENKQIKSGGESDGIYSTIIESEINHEKVSFHEMIRKILQGEKNASL